MPQMSDPNQKVQENMIQFLFKQKHKTCQEKSQNMSGNMPFKWINFFPLWVKKNASRPPTELTADDPGVNDLCRNGQQLVGGQPFEKGCHPKVHKKKTWIKKDGQLKQKNQKNSKYL